MRQHGCVALAVLFLLSTTASAGVAGRVLSSDAKPLTGATINAYAQEDSEARAERLLAGRNRSALATARSAGDGTFQVEGSSAVVDLEVRAAGFAPSFQVAASGDRVLVRLKPAKNRTGIVSAHGKPVADAVVVWTSGSARETTGDGIVRSGADGAYEIPDPDSWANSLLIHHPDFATLQLERGNARWPSSLRHELKPGVRMEGRVIEEGTGRPVEGATLWVGAWPVAKSTRGGAFSVPHAAPGRQTILAKSAALLGSAKMAATNVVIPVKPVKVLSGVVRDGESLAPVAGAVVALHSRLTVAQTTTTDPSGRYVFPTLAPARYIAYVRRAGYATKAEGYPGHGEPIDLRVSSSIARDFALVRLRRLFGRVMDEEGKPVDNALVAVTGKGAPGVYDEGLLGMEGPTTGTTAGGDFALAIPGSDGAPENENEDEPSLIVLKEGYAVGRVAVPKRGAKDGARPLVVILTRGVEVKGWIRAVDGTPLPGVAVTIAEDGSFLGRVSPIQLFLWRADGGGWVTSDAQGRFSANLHPTVHHFLFRKGGYVRKIVRDLDVGSSRSIDVVLDRGVAVRGQVVRSDGSGVPGVEVSIRHSSPLINAATTTGADGAFVIEDLNPGRYDLVFRREETGLVETRAVDAPSSDVRLQLGPTGTLRGRVLDAKSQEPVPHFWVSVKGGRVDAGREDYVRRRSQEVTDANGAFAVEEVPVGEIGVTVSAEGYTSKRVDDLTISGRDAPEIEVRLDPAATVRGRVTTLNGQALEFVAVSAENEKGDRFNSTSDEKGEYELSGVNPGSIRLEFRREGYLALAKTVNAPDGARVDVALSRGLSLRGLVVGNGVGVAEATVTATSSMVGADSQSVPVGAGGAFKIQGLAAGRYSVTAEAPGSSEATLEDVDVEKAGPLRLVLEPVLTAVLSGIVTGLPPSDDIVTRMVTAEGEDGRSETASIDSAGRFRIAKAPAGPVKVTANVAWMSGAMRSSHATELTLTPGSENQAVVEFLDDVVISGIVTREGAPVLAARVSFRQPGHRENSGTAQTDAGGRYEIVGVEPGPHRVTVSRSGLFFETDHLVSGSAQFDIDVTGAALQGRVVDASNGEPVAGVNVSLWFPGGRESTWRHSFTAGGQGEFSGRSLREGRYRLLTAKQGYGQHTREIDLTRGGVTEIVVELVGTAGLRVTVVDARTEKPLDATVVVRDRAKRIVVNQAPGMEPDGTFNIALAEGHYLLSASASGYGTVTLPVTAPGRGLRVGLTPGGTLVLESERDLRGRLRLVQPDGEEYVRCWCNGIADIPVAGKRTKVENVTPGSYTLEVVDSFGRSGVSKAVVIREGQVSTVVLE